MPVVNFFDNCEILYNQQQQFGILLPFGTINAFIIDNNGVNTSYFEALEGSDSLITIRNKNTSGSIKTIYLTATSTNKTITITLLYNGYVLQTYKTLNASNGDYYSYVPWINAKGAFIYKNSIYHQVYPPLPQLTFNGFENYKAIPKQPYTNISIGFTNLSVTITNTEIKASGNYVYLKFYPSVSLTLSQATKEDLWIEIKGTFSDMKRSWYYRSIIKINQNTSSGTTVTSNVIQCAAIADKGSSWQSGELLGPIMSRNFILSNISKTSLTTNSLPSDWSNFDMLLPERGAVLKSDSTNTFYYWYNNDYVPTYYTEGSNGHFNYLYNIHWRNIKYLPKLPSNSPCTINSRSNLIRLVFKETYNSSTWKYYNTNASIQLSGYDNTTANKISDTNLDLALNLSLTTGNYSGPNSTQYMPPTGTLTTYLTYENPTITQLGFFPYGYFTFNLGNRFTGDPLMINPPDGSTITRVFDYNSTNKISNFYITLGNKIRWNTTRTVNKKIFNIGDTKTFTVTMNGNSSLSDYWKYALNTYDGSGDPDASSVLKRPISCILFSYNGTITIKFKYVNFWLTEKYMNDYTVTMYTNQTNNNAASNNHDMAYSPDTFDIEHNRVWSYKNYAILQTRFTAAEGHSRLFGEGTETSNYFESSMTSSSFKGQEIPSNKINITHSSGSTIFTIELTYDQICNAYKNYYTGGTIYMGRYYGARTSELAVGPTSGGFGTRSLDPNSNSSFTVNLACLCIFANKNSRELANQMTFALINLGQYTFQSIASEWKFTVNYSS